MVIKHNTVKKDFIQQIKNKRIYCYGAGKVFKDFKQVYPHVAIQAVIDKNLSLNGKTNINEGVPVITIREFIDVCDADSVLIITCFDYQEVEKELNTITELNNLPCYVYCLMQGMFGIKDEREVSDKYQITEFKLQDFNAGQKAPADVAVIAAAAGYKILTVNRGTQRFGLSQTESEWDRISDCISNDSTVLVQLPLVDATDGIKRLYEVKRKKHIRIIAVVHDIDVLRGDITEYNRSQYNILKTLADVWIVHNEYMINELSYRGFCRDKMVSLDIFDYLIEHYEEPEEDDGIIIAGNLDRKKSGYVYKLDEIKNVRFNLFGANYSEDFRKDNISYYGAFLPDDLIHNLRGRYGLVWDGDSIGTCSGAKGEYLRINNPHKLSLYLATGLPVIIWSKAAEAQFVIKKNIGIAVDSLLELPHKLAVIDDSSYNIMKRNAKEAGLRLRNGEYMKSAIARAEEVLKKERGE